MPIYAYKCGSCGHAKDVLQKVSDEPLSVCPACGASTFAKQLTAAGFQLKGSGWYATDFKNGSAAPAPDKAADASAEKSGDKAADKAPEKAAGDKSAPAKSEPAAPAPAPKSDAPSAGG
ncbi:zinc ribbon domain-containing protein [Caenimonas sedimenti]|uniref:Zinc ribbon domain-containing protein n=1 Tax=Caenimonas sedimenti TaxID=2596921 RepID=A0A562ZVB8_9BURK|nr:zinc ribbon domain-containing protein [Caenimonas sedimenti]TWO72255.1 zinc ribbon domain-containing protein [Caenimonas sedimenti]